MSPLSQYYTTALVTGASGGLGCAFTEMLLAEGVEVWGTARTLERLKPLDKKERFHPVVLDLNDGAVAERIYMENARTAPGGAFDLVVNNAGYGVFAAFATEPFATWQAQVDALLVTTMRLSHLALRDMVARNRGCLVNVSSLAVEFPLPYMTGYNVAKAGLTALNESLLFETRGKNLCVIDFRLGDFRTPFNRAMQQQPTIHQPESDPQLAKAWQVSERNLAAAPEPAVAARSLRRVLSKRRSGSYRAGSFFQATLAPFLARLAPSSWRRAVAARYLGAV